MSPISCGLIAQQSSGDPGT